MSASIASITEKAEKTSYDEDVTVADKETEAVELTDSARTTILRKIDVHLLPFVSLLYLLFLWVCVFPLWNCA
jgi:hypothetical protein